MRQFRVKDRRALMWDLTVGVVVGLLSVPLSMGCAQVAGLPPRYGLYGSLFPVLVFGLLTTSPRFVIGVDAAPAALSASLLPALGLSAGSPEAAAAMPVVTLLAAAWLFLFCRLHLGRFAKFISEPVLGGCVTGIASVVALAQLPQLFGGVPGSGRAPALLAHLFLQGENFHPLSFLLGTATIAFILLGRRKTRASLSVVMMIAGILLTLVFRLDQYGVA
ncbi:MAG: SulP family inorganic anion transporter, partial [Oscillibacter sp.]|nr:SulP family inorganic anion transporter [Oscillibacter sp.]